MANRGIDLITFCLTEKTLAATLQWSAKPLCCTSIHQPASSVENGSYFSNMIGYWIMESGVVGPNKLPSEVTFTPSVDKDCSTCGNSANIIAPNQPFVGTTASLRRRWLQLNKNGWSLPSVVKAQSLYGGRPRHQSLRAGVDFRDGGQGDLRRARKMWRWERRFIIKGWFRI